MKTRFPHLKAVATAIALAATFAGSAAQAQDRRGIDVDDYAVYVDLPTAFAFVKLPHGWKFVGKLDVDQLRHLPPGTLTTLLTEAESADGAVKTASSDTGGRATH